MSAIQKNELFEDAQSEQNASVENEQNALQNTQEKKDDVILEVDDLQKHFVLSRTLFGKPTSTLKAVDHVSFKLKRGTTIGIVGESGCGKPRWAEPSSNCTISTAEKCTTTVKISPISPKRRCAR